MALIEIKRCEGTVGTGPCGAKATHEYDGRFFCKRHDPASMRERRAEASIKSEARAIDKFDVEKKSEATLHAAVVDIIIGVQRDRNSGFEVNDNEVAANIIHLVRASK